MTPGRTSSADSTFVMVMIGDHCSCVAGRLRELIVRTDDVLARIDAVLAANESGASIPKPTEPPVSSRVAVRRY